MPSDGFKIFGATHIAILILTLFCSLVFIIAVRKTKNPKIEKLCNAILLGMIILSTGFAYYYKGTAGWLSIKMDLPMHLCDWAMIVIAVTLIKKNQYSFELAYFWGLGGTLQALITPDITEDFPAVSFILFFLSHSLVIVSILYFTLGLKMRPYPVSIIRVFIWSQVYFVVAFGVNLLLDANYGYLMHKPPNPTLIDYLGEWPYYLISLELVAIVSFCIYYLPFFIKDKLGKNSATN